MTTSRTRSLRDVGLFFLRGMAGGLMVIQHGLPKLVDFGDKASVFPDPLGVGSTLSLVLAIFGELVCATAVALGVFTRVTAIPVIITMLVAAFLVHADDPFSKQEFPLLYAAIFTSLVLTGPGRFSLDHAVLGRERE